MKLNSAVAGALSRFFEGGGGPGHAAIGSSFALAEYNEPEYDGQQNKEQRVLLALRKAPYVTAVALTEEILGVLRSRGYFDRAETSEVRQLRVALGRAGATLSADGFIDWPPGSENALQDNLTELNGYKASTADAATKQSIGEAAEPAGDASVVEVHEPTLALLLDVLRRLPAAYRPLRHRRRDREAFSINDEYDFQDLAEYTLRTLFRDVRPEEPTPSSAGSSSKADFLVRNERLAVELKVVRRGTNISALKGDILRDINDYATHPMVATLIVVVWDLDGSFPNPDGFEGDLSRKGPELHLHVLVIN